MRHPNPPASNPIAFADADLTCLPAADRPDAGLHPQAVLPHPSGFVRCGAVLVGLSLIGMISGCGAIDKRALQKLACEQAAASIDMQSVATLDTLRKALGVAPDVDPIQHCRSLGAAMDPPAGGGSGAQAEGEAKSEGEGESKGE